MLQAGSSNIADRNTVLSNERIMRMDKKLLNLVDYNSCVALIPARGGSKSVPKKNIRIFSGHPLIAYSIAVARLSRNIDRVIVSTDSEEIADIAQHYGAEIPFLRPAKFAQDDSPDIDFVKHTIQWLAENEGKIPEYIAHIRVTTPTRDYRTIDNAISKIQQDGNASSLRSGHICVHPPYKWFQFNEKKYVKPLMPGMTCDEANLARQGFPQVLIPNGYIDVLKANYIIENDQMHGDRMIGFITEEIPDIDTEADLHKLAFYDGLRDAMSLLKSDLDHIVEKQICR